MRKNKIVFFILAALLITGPLLSRSEGISVDAGLTPAQDRIIIRIQYRNMVTLMNGNEMVMHMMPLVVAYGLTPDVTLMMRNGYRFAGSNETMMTMENQWMDPFLMGKVKLYRLNTRNYVLGVAGFAGSTFPLWGSSPAGTYSPVVGINASFRPGLWSFDLNNAFEWVDYSTGSNEAADHLVNLNLAISRNIILPGLNNLVLSPVQEFTWVKSFDDGPGLESFGFISPGFQLVSPHVKFESLYQIAVNSSPETGAYPGNRFIVGFRFMF